MVLTHENVHGMMGNICKTNSTEVLRHSNMQITNENRRKQDENMRKLGENISKHGENGWKQHENISKHGENIVSFIWNHFVNKVDQVLLPKQFHMTQKLCFSLNGYVTSTLIDMVPIITISYSIGGFGMGQ